MVVLTTQRSIRDRGWSSLRLHRVNKEFVGLDGTNYMAVADVNIDIHRGDFYCLLGPSGCGKSTILNLVAGFEAATSGTITIEGNDNTRNWTVPIEGPETDRTVIFQDVTAALFPWLNVEENILFGPKLTGAKATDYRDKLDSYLHMIGLTRHAKKFPFELSGGMKQRVQIARALIVEPEILLMDEPFAALDEQTRLLLGEDLSVLLARTHKTIVFVTHSLVEAVFLADRVAVFTARPGRIKTVLSVDEPHPRTPAFMTSAKLAGLRNELYELLHDEVRKAMETGAVA
jgi:NitT/TauT family transport system ATP-binding protein